MKVVQTIENGCHIKAVKLRLSAGTKGFSAGTKGFSAGTKAFPLMDHQELHAT